MSPSQKDLPGEREYLPSRQWFPPMALRQGEVLAVHRVLQFAVKFLWISEVMLHQVKIVVRVNRGEGAPYHECVPMSYEHRVHFYEFLSDLLFHEG